MLDKETSSFKDFALNFTKKVLGKHQPHNMCFTVSFPLFLHLNNNDFKNTLRIGTFYGSDPAKENVQHFWLMLDDEKLNIIDPTAKQFYPDMEENILFGPKPKQYCEHFVPLDKALSYSNGSKQ